ncbi:MAG: TolC family protein [Melioribacteraceae bacterium]|nr:TolC family protein [Melioribacteraceae bacterium]
MNSKKSLLIVIFVVSIMNVSAQHKNESLNDLINEAIQVSPKIKMLRSKLDVAGSKIEQGTNLPDPTLTLGLINMPTNSFSFTQEPMTGKIIGLSQAIPFPGKLSTASDVKAIDTLIVEQEIEDLQNEIRKNVSTLYYDLRLVREETKLTNESKGLLEQISDVVKSKYEVSKASLQNVIQVEVQITRVNDRIETLKGNEDALLSELNAILLRDENSQISSNKISSIDQNSYSTASLVEAANENRPFLKGIKLLEQKSKLKEDLADYSYYPNFKLGLQYSQRDYNELTGRDFSNLFSVVVGITLPINYGGKNSAKVNEAKHLQALNRDQYNSSIQLLKQSFGKITAKLLEFQNRNKLISESLLPQAELAFQASLADYQVGRIDFVNVINTENDILKIKTDLLKIRTQYAKNIAQLEFLVGTEINDSNEKDSEELR